MKKNILHGLVVCTSICICIVALSSIAQTKKEGLTAKDLNIRFIKDPDDRKKRFFDFMRPIINDENVKVLALREKLLEAKKNNNNKQFVIETAKNYSTKWQQGEENWDKLLERVDAVALEMVLAQSAKESAWGQSRFAQQGNNFFGQWCNEKGCGIIPDKRNINSRHEVARFNSVNESVRSYIKNINTTRAYYLLRKIRSENRAAGKSPDANAQALGLIKYSQQGEKYVTEVRSMIRNNKMLMLGI